MIYPWLQTQWQQLLNQYQQKRLPHALLIEGPAGLGKLALAENLAALVLCEQQGTAACGYCRGCVLHAATNHPDYFKLQPEEDAKNIKIEAIRELTNQLSQHSHQSGYQVAILQPAEKMNRAASNALLKTLEEPAGQVLIILVADQSSALPVTILSRCQRLLCSASQSVEAQAWLQRELSAEVQSIELLLQAADYAPLQALKLANLDYLNCRNHLLFQLTALKTGQLNVSKIVADWLKQDIALLLASLQLIVLDLIRLSLNVKQDYLANSDCPEDLLNLQRSGDLQQWIKFLNALQQLKSFSLAANNLNLQMLLENFLVKIA